MRTRRLILPLLVTAIPAVILAGQKADLRLLHRIERVDGRNSGLDADTVRGLTPEQMTETASLPFTRERLYTHASRVLQSSGTERLITVDCDQPSDIAINCSGGAYDGSTAFPITWMGVVIRAGDQGNLLPERCMLVVGAGATTPNLEATIRCLRVP